MKNIKIGIPKGLYIYEKPILFEKFFINLGCEVVYSKNTDKEVLDNGIKLSIDEACLASKIFIGHVKDLLDRKEKENIDYIFIPRICSFKNNKSICVKFFAMYDICKNTFKEEFLTFNLDYDKGKNEILAFVILGNKLGFSYSNIIASYLKARNMQREYDKKKLVKQYEKMAINKHKENVLIVAHPYISYDKYVGYQITKYLESLGANIIYADVNKSSLKKVKSYNELSSSIYWNPSINLLNGINEYMSYIDGIIYLTVFPCGPDSLVNELLLRKVNNVPSINLILDEQEIGAGVFTRLESFYDVLEQRRDLKKVSGE